MSTPRQRPVHIKDNDGNITEGLWHLIELNKRDRLIRAAKIWGGCWLIGLVVLPIPIVHLIVPPVMLIAGAVAAFLRFRVTELAEKVNGECPVHHQEIELELEAGATIPVWTYCPECKAPLQLDIFDEQGRPV